MLSGFRSRWMTPRSWAAATAATTGNMISAVRSAERGPSRAIDARQGFPFEKLHDEIGLALVDPDVVNVGHVGMVNA